MSRMNRKERNNFLMRVGAVLIAVCMVAALALPAFAADTSVENEPYKYTVRIFPGDKGTINGSTDPIVREVEANYSWTRGDFDCLNQAASKTDRYYVTGMRESGRDNNTNTLYKSGNFTVDRDIDLVVSYGIKGSDVPYTINYVEYGTNKVLRKSETYHGNDGDQPAVAYLYVEGYVPQYKVMTGTIKAGSSNEWTFYYISLDKYKAGGSANTQSKGGVKTQSTGTAKTGGSGTTSGGTTSTGGGTSAGGGTSTGSGTTSGGSSTSTSTGTGTKTAEGSPAAGGGTVTTSGSAAGTQGGTLLASNGTVNTLKNGPVEIVNLDETQVPLTEYTGEEDGEKNIDSEITASETQGVVRASGMSGPVKMIIGMAVVVIIAGAGWFFLRKVSGSRDE